MNILILGATGFIGFELARQLAADGHHVTGMGRDARRAITRLPQVAWIRADLANLTEEKHWSVHLAGHDAVINCAGALQDGALDNLALVQERAQIALQNAANAAGISCFTQISAETGGAAGHTAFLSTKRRADKHLAASGLPFVILRPSLVIGRNAYGGTALIRALAAIPFATPLVDARSPVAAVTVDDVAKAVRMSLSGDIPSGSDIGLAAERTRTLAELVGLHRAWLGLPAQPVISLPVFLTPPVSAVADLLGRLGWRSPLRSTAITVMSEGVVARNTDRDMTFEDPAFYLGRHPAGAQDIWFARLYLLKPLIFALLSFFWIASGAIAILRLQDAAAHFLPFMGNGGALSLTVATSFLDIALGVWLLYRPYARKALLGMLVVTIAYLAGSLIAEPALWLDPLGPMIKVIPSIGLTLAALAILDER